MAPDRLLTIHKILALHIHFLSMKKSVFSVITFTFGYEISIFLCENNKKQSFFREKTIKISFFVVINLIGSSELYFFFGQGSV